MKGSTGKPEDRSGYVPEMMPEPDLHKLALVAFRAKLRTEGVTNADEVEIPPAYASAWYNVVKAVLVAAKSYPVQARRVALVWHSGYGGGHVVRIYDGEFIGMNAAKEMASEYAKKHYHDYHDEDANGMSVVSGTGWLVFRPIDSEEC